MAQVDHLGYGMIAYMIIRKERRGDQEAIRAIHVAAFGSGINGEEPVEGDLVDALRRSDGWIPELSLVAVVDGVMNGHVVTTRGFIGAHPALGLAPIGVIPAGQRTGIGSALMHATIGAAEARGDPLIALLGEPGYYARLGFVASSEVSIVPPDSRWGNHFQVLLLSAFTTEMRCAFRYAAPFDDL